MSTSLETRYDDGYKVARATIRTAKLLRAIGLAFACLSFLSGVYITLEVNVVSGVLTLFAAFLTMLSTLAIYTVMAAQAQLIAAVLDTAINTSPLISQEVKWSMIKPIE